MKKFNRLIGLAVLPLLWAMFALIVFASCDAVRGENIDWTPLPTKDVCDCPNRCTCADVGCQCGSACFCDDCPGKAKAAAWQEWHNGWWRHSSGGWWHAQLGTRPAGFNFNVAPVQFQPMQFQAAMFGGGRMMGGCSSGG